VGNSSQRINKISATASSDNVPVRLNLALATHSCILSSLRTLTQACRKVLHQLQVKIKLAPTIEPVSECVRERRRKARIKLSCFVLVRPIEPEPEYFESIILTENSCRDGLSFRTDNPLYCQRMRLLITFPFSHHPCAINQDYIAEVVRKEALPDGRYNVAVRLLTTARLSIPPISKLRSNNVWNALWQRVRTNPNAAKPDCAGLVNRSR
jgi:hypothetical protein